jgi:hypothetical protein
MRKKANLEYGQVIREINTKRWLHLIELLSLRYEITLISSWMSGSTYLWRRTEQRLRFE